MAAVAVTRAAPRDGGAAHAVEGNVEATFTRLTREMERLFVEKRLDAVSNADKLYLYARYKQATSGALRRPVAGSSGGGGGGRADMLAVVVLRRWCCQGIRRRRATRRWGSVGDSCGKRGRPSRAALVPR